MREIVDAILYQARVGRQWRYLPHDFPPYTAVYYYVGKWRDDGADQDGHPDRARLRQRSQGHDGAGSGQEEPWPQAEHHHRHPGPAHRGGRGCGQRARQRHRHHAAGPGRRRQPVGDRGLGERRVKNAVIDRGAALGIDIEVVQRDPHTKDFAPAPKRWIVEQTLGTRLLHRRLARDYETLPASAASWIRWSMTDVMPRWLTGHAALPWRDPPRIGARAPTREAAHA